MTKGFMDEGFQNKTLDEQREIIRELIHEGAADVKAAFLNPKTGKTMDMHELADEMGEEEAIDLIMKMITNNEAKAVSFSKKDISNLVLKFKRGECTDEELIILKMVVESMRKDTSFQEQALGIMLDVINFTQNNAEKPKLYDVFSFISVLSMISLSNTPDLETYKYKDALPAIMITLSQQIGDDIYDTWKNSCSSPVSNEMVILGLLHLLQKLSDESKMEIIDANIIADLIGIELDKEDSDEKENGSNDSKEKKPKIAQPKTYEQNADEGKEMRNMLKE